MYIPKQDPTESAPGWQTQVEEFTLKHLLVL